MRPLRVLTLLDPHIRKRESARLFRSSVDGLQCPCAINTKRLAGPLAVHWNLA